ncbi:hypothetical protein [Mycolicibacterium litorale]|uniref:PepSY domain-containing protein n=1 Tax=Mycolicibacterium litorale TaxID=758802 RepID=A0AAD1MWU4_9MYCO|nr:hypothetical protein [Mycolicibacterium litorale]MCV7417668.1 hypothetical protein [Mycolicibacterium litorale]TDY06944.1 hypothetical protein BCL50_3284 [Mycolicibacterium litorale]BBY18897.1 hypothetical protein MLIT_44890 [Mycolicibacterium litorale]
MNKFGFAAVAASGLAAAFLGLAAPAQAAPAGPDNAQDAISSLDDRGYSVRVNHQGMVKPLDQSSVVSVRYDNDDRVVYVNVR